MHDKEAIEMMNRCLHDIEDLRRQRDILAPRAEAYEVIRTVVGLLPKLSQGYSEDIAWTLKKKIKELQEKDGKSSSDL